MDKLPNKPSPPQWVETVARVGKGQDLLGLRLPAEGIGQKLLKAVTTISPTVRYLSVRAWAVRQYALAHLPDAWPQFRAYVAKVEAAIALGNLLADPGTQGLVGPERAKEKFATEGDELTLEPLVKQLAASAYTGPSLALEISWTRPSGVPGYTERGVALAEAVSALIDKTAFATQLAANPDQAVYSRSVLKELGQAFPIGRPNCRERQILIDCIFPDGPVDSLGAYSTYRLLLQLAYESERKPVAEDVYEAAVRPADPLLAVYAPCLDGWLWYLVRDVLAVTHEAALQTLVGKVQSLNTGCPAQQVLNELLGADSELENSFETFGVLPSGPTPLDRPLRDLAECVRKAVSPTKGTPARWSGNLQESMLIRAASTSGIGAFSLVVLAWLLVDQRVNASGGIPERYADLLSYDGEFRFGLSSVVQPVLHDLLERSTIREACYKLASRTANQHLHIAWARLRQDPTKDVSVLKANGNIWSAEECFPAGRVASRLREAVGWLTQLGLLDQKGCTPDGQSLLQRLRAPMTQEAATG